MRLALLGLATLLAAQTVQPGPSKRAAYQERMRRVGNLPFRLVLDNRPGGGPIHGDVFEAGEHYTYETKVCSGTLINTPHEWRISHDGSVLITVEDFFHQGHQHTLVFYRCAGALTLTREYAFVDLLTPDEIRQNSMEILGDRVWLQNATIRVDPNYFAIHLKTGRNILFSLPGGELQK